MPLTAAEKKRKQRERDSADPDRKSKKLDSIFMFGEVEVSAIEDSDEIVWFKAVDLARALEMEDPHDSIYQSIDKIYCQRYEELASLLPQYRNIPNMQPKTIFVNETGMNMYLLRSRKPKAEAFSKWVCGEVLPSIRKTNRFEMEPSNNPYRKLSEFLEKQNEEFKKENEEFKKENGELKNKNVNLEKEVGEMKNKNVNLENKNGEFKKQNEEFKKENGELKIKNTEHMDDIKKYVNLLFEMKPSCVQKLESEVKNEYFVLYRKYDPDETPLDSMPYYACRVQWDSLDQRRSELLSKYPNLVKLLQFLVPNSVNFFNLVLEKMSNFIERGKGQSFKIKGIDEKQLLEMIENIHRSTHGGLKDNNTYIKV